MKKYKFDELFKIEADGSATALYDLDFPGEEMDMGKGTNVSKDFRSGDIVLADLKDRVMIGAKLGDKVVITGIESKKSKKKNG